MQLSLYLNRSSNTNLTSVKRRQVNELKRYGMALPASLPSRLIPIACLILCAAIGASKMNCTIDAMCCWMKIIVDYVYPS